MLNRAQFANIIHRKAKKKNRKRRRAGEAKRLSRTRRSPSLPSRAQLPSRAISAIYEPPRFMHNLYPAFLPLRPKTKKAQAQKKISEP